MIRLTGGPDIAQIGRVDETLSVEVYGRSRRIRYEIQRSARARARGPMPSCARSPRRHGKPSRARSGQPAARRRRTRQLPELPGSDLQLPDRRAAAADQVSLSSPCRFEPAEFPSPACIGVERPCRAPPVPCPPPSPPSERRGLADSAVGACIDGFVPRRCPISAVAVPGPRAARRPRRRRPRPRRRRRRPCRRRRRRRPAPSPVAVPEGSVDLAVAARTAAAVPARVEWSRSCSLTSRPRTAASCSSATFSLPPADASASLL